TSNMALGGPPLVKAVVGEDITAEELGGSKVHCEISGVGDLEVEDDEHCLRVVKEYLSYFPSHNQEPPPVIACEDAAERRDEALLTILPDSPRRAYEPDLIVGWPTAEISVMGPEGGTNIVFRKEIAAAAEPDAERAKKVEQFRQLISPYIAAGAALIDDVIDPRDTRPTLIRAL